MLSMLIKSLENAKDREILFFTKPKCYYLYLLILRSSFHPFKCYLNFRVIIDSRAKIIDIIQNLTITLGSGHPFNSK